MGKSKKIIMTILTIIVTIIILIVGFLYTDMFKSNKILFATYIFNDDLFNMFNEKELNEYLDKKSINKYKYSGNLYIDIYDNNIIDNQILSVLNKKDIDVSGKIDSIKHISNNKFNIEFGKLVNIPFEVINEKTKIGIKNKLFGDKYYVLKKDIEETEKIDTNLSNDIKPNTSLEYEVEKISNIINKNINNEMFEKVRNKNIRTITLKLSKDELENISKKVLEQIKKDNLFVDNEKIDDLIKEIDENNDINEIKISINIKNRKIISYEINVVKNGLDDVKIVILKDKERLFAKITNGSGKTYNIDIAKEKNKSFIQFLINIKENNESEIKIETKFTNIEDLDNVNESYNIKILNGFKTEFECKLNDIIIFDDKLEVENLNNENSIIFDNEFDKLFEKINI